MGEAILKMASKSPKRLGVRRQAQRDAALGKAENFAKPSKTRSASACYSLSAPIRWEGRGSGRGVGSLSSWDEAIFKKWPQNPPEASWSAAASEARRRFGEGGEFSETYQNAVGIRLLFPLRSHPMGGERVRVRCGSPEFMGRGDFKKMPSQIQIHLAKRLGVRRQAKRDAALGEAENLARPTKTRSASACYSLSAPIRWEGRGSG